MRDLVARFLSQSISRRSFLKGLATAGISGTAAQSILHSLIPTAHAQGAAAKAIKVVEGTGGICFAEQLIASGVKYVFGNSASEDAQFYEALVDRPQLKYILTPHEGPGAAMAAGYVKASGEPTIVMQAAVVGLANAMGQMFNAFKEQTPLVFYSYRTDQTRPRRARRLRGSREPGADRRAAHQIQLARAARRHDPRDRAPRLQGRVDAAVRPDLRIVAFGLQRRARAHRNHRPVDKFDPRMRVRPNPAEAERAAKLLVEARMPLMIVGDEIYNAKAVGEGGQARRAARHAGDAGAADVHQLPAEAHPLWVGALPAARLASARRSRRTPTSSSTSATSCSTTARSRSSGAAPSSSTCASTAGAWATSWRPRCRSSPTWRYGLDDLTAAVAAHDAGPEAEGERAGARGAALQRKGRGRCGPWWRRTPTGTATR